MEALFQIISTLIDFVVDQVGDALNADVKHRVFLKQAEIQNAITTQMQDRYSNLEDALGQAALLQYQTQLEDETKKKVVAGNLMSIAGFIFIVVIIIAIIFIVRKK